MKDSSILEINLLGPVEITANGRPLTIKRKIERVILYLLAGKHTTVSRTTLIDMIWPNEDSIDTRAALRTALSRLRRALPDPEFLLTDMDQVSLDLSRCRVDYHLFDNHYQSLNNLLSIYQENRPLPSQIVEQIQEALGLWHGDAFIMGDDLTSYPEVEHWRKFIERLITHQRRFLERRLAAHYYAAGQLDIALNLYVDLSRAELADVSIHLTVVDILTKLGRLQDAIDYCDGLEVRYEQAYNAPLPDVLLKRCEYARILFDTSKVQSRMDWPVPLTMNLHFIGRQPELKLLRQMYFRGGLVEIKGQMGCGKTRLVQELYQTLKPTPKLMYAPSHERENTLPLAPIVHCLRRHIPNDFWKDLKPLWVNQLSILLPELSEISDNREALFSEKLPTGKQRLFDALLQTFTLVSKKFGRILFFLDDAQWADKQTLQVLDYFFNHDFFNEHGLLIVATRTEESNAALEDMVDNLHKIPHVEILPINGLSPTELRDLAQQALNVSPPPSFIDQLYRETNGNPFIALEIIRNLLETQADLNQFSSATHLTLPKNVQALIRRRFNRLEEKAQHLLQYAAVLGDDFSIDLLQAIADLNDFSNTDIFSPLIQTGFIQHTEDENPQSAALHFVHEKLREVVLKETPPPQLKILHRRAAQILEKGKHATADAVIIAGHFMAGGDIANAFEWYLNAADRAYALSAQEDALHAYQKAELIYQNAPPQLFENRDAVRLYQSWSRFAYETYQYSMAEETGIKLLNFGEKEGDPYLIGMAHIALAEACFLRFELDAGLMLLEKAYENLKLANEENGIIIVFDRKSKLFWWKLQYEDCRQAAQEVLARVKASREVTPELHRLSLSAEIAICLTYFAQGEAKKCLEKALNIQQTYTDNLGPIDKIRIFYNLGYAYLISANFEESIQCFTKALEFSLAINSILIVEICLYRIAEAESIQGKLDHAFEHASKALKYGEKYDHNHAIISANMILGSIFSNLENTERALQYNRVAQIRESFSSTSFHGLENEIQLAINLIKSDKFAEAKELINSIKKITAKLGTWQHFMRSLLIDQQFDIRSSNYDAANHKISSAIQLAQDKGMPYHLLWGQLAQASLFFLQGQGEFAAQNINKIIQKSRLLNTPFLTIATLIQSAQIQRSNPALIPDFNVQAIFDDLMRQLEANTQSEPLKTELQKAKAIWSKKIQPQ
jgi:DNA-binding SARP family transcriptional activator